MLTGQRRSPGVRMSNNDPRPRWWVLYAVLPLTVGLFVLEVNATMSPGWHKVVEVGIVLCAVGYAQLWLSAKTLALISREDGSRRTTVDPGRSRLHVVPKPAEAQPQVEPLGDRE